jgi:hypothetical protein
MSLACNSIENIGRQRHPVLLELSSVILRLKLDSASAKPVTQCGESLAEPKVDCASLLLIGGFLVKPWKPVPK